MKKYMKKMLYSLLFSVALAAGSFTQSQDVEYQEEFSPIDAATASCDIPFKQSDVERMRKTISGLSQSAQRQLIACIENVMVCLRDNDPAAALAIIAASGLIYLVYKGVKNLYKRAQEDEKFRETLQNTAFAGWITLVIGLIVRAVWIDMHTPAQERYERVPDVKAWHKPYTRPHDLYIEHVDPIWRDLKWL
jgi:hypothetical protein